MMDTIPLNQKNVTGIFLIAFLLLSGCANSRQSSKKINEAGEAMEKIEQAQAMEYSRKAFRAAQYKLEEARQLAEKGKHRNAILKAEEAKVAAELAGLKTLSKKADESLSNLQKTIKSLKEKLEQYRREQ